MSYSRRQLEALGEPFGDSATRKEAGRIVYGGGGSGGGKGSSGGGNTDTQTTYRYYASFAVAICEEEPLPLHQTSALPAELSRNQTLYSFGPDTTLNLLTLVAGQAHEPKRQLEGEQRVAPRVRTAACPPAGHRVPHHRPRPIVVTWAGTQEEDALRHAQVRGQLVGGRPCLAQFPERRIGREAGGLDASGRQVHLRGRQLAGAADEWIRVLGELLRRRQRVGQAAAHKEECGPVSLGQFLGQERRGPRERRFQALRCGL